MNITRHGDQWQRKKVVYYHCFRDLPIANQKLHKLIKIAAYAAGRLLLLSKKPQAPLAGVSGDIFMGSDYWALTSDCARLIHDTMVKDVKFMRYFLRAFVPSELCIQTLVFNSPYAKQAIEFEERTYPGLVRLTPLHNIEYNKEIKICDEQDLERLIASDKMFFRKASSTRSAQLMQLINRMR